MKTSLRTLLFDFDGVLADTEPVHMNFFREILGEEGITLTESDYWERYLGLDDRACFEAVFRDGEKPLAPGKMEELVLRKNEAVLAYVTGRPILLPGVVEFLEGVFQKYYLAVVSGGRRNEIEAVLEGGGIRRKFHLIVAADDLSKGKPDPEGFLTAVRLLNRDFVPPSEILLAAECLAIEDSPWGIEAAHRAGIKCLALLTSYPKERLAGADVIAPNLKSVRWEEITGLF